MVEVGLGIALLRIREATAFSATVLGSRAAHAGRSTSTYCTTVRVRSRRTVAAARRIRRLQRPVQFLCGSAQQNTRYDDSKLPPALVRAAERGYNRTLADKHRRRCRRRQNPSRLIVSGEVPTHPVSITAKLDEARPEDDVAGPISPDAFSHGKTSSSKIV